MSKVNHLNSLLSRLHEAWLQLEENGRIDAFLDVAPADDEPEDVKVLLRTIRSHMEAIQQIYIDAIGDGVHVLESVDDRLYRFYMESAEPRFYEICKAVDRRDHELLWDLLWDDDLSWLQSVYPPRARRVLNTYKYGLEQFEILLENLRSDGVEETVEKIESLTDADAAWGLVDSGYFIPDSWILNQNELRPVIIAKGTDRVPAPVILRLRAAYSSFLFENWIAVMAMCRSILEYAILDRGDTLSLDVRDTDVPSREADLKTLIDRVVLLVRSLDSRRLHRIRECGNAVMHPKPGSNLAEIFKMPKARSIALQNLRYLGEALEQLYTGAGL